MHKAGFVNIVGNPNVGKSTLMNVLVGERISIATFKAQTTRHRIMGIYNTDDMQIVFSDTPGVLKPNYKLQESMLNFSTSALTDADVLLYVTDVVETPDKHNDFVEKVCIEVRGGLVLVITASVQIVDVKAKCQLLVDVDGEVGLEAFFTVHFAAGFVVGKIGVRHVAVGEKHLVGTCEKTGEGSHEDGRFAFLPFEEQT